MSTYPIQTITKLASLSGGTDCMDPWMQFNSLPVGRRGAYELIL